MVLDYDPLWDEQGKLKKVENLEMSSVGHGELAVWG